MGHTSGCALPGWSWPVHPHIRGAYTRKPLSGPLWVGSSPHTWGIRGILPFLSPPFRFIPPYVGHTSHRPGCPTRYPVHPHIRGAYLPCSNTVGRFSGSSPHTWGIRHHSGQNVAPDWFIPTYVGHTRPVVAGSRPRPGSSPHTWGIPVQVVRRFYGVRFIPTYVGHTGYYEAGVEIYAVHPHIRGAYTGPP